MSENIGSSAAGHLRAAFGGTAIAIPKRKKGANWATIEQTIGNESAAELVRIYGGESLYIAKDAKAMQRWHKARISELRADGKTWSQISKAHTFMSSFTERWIRKLGNQDKPQSSAAQQPSLFDAPAGHHLDALFGGTRSD